MNHSKGVESTSLGERYSLTYLLSSTLCSAAEQAPTNAALRPGRTFKERNLCGGFRSFLLWRNLRFRHSRYSSEAGLSPASLQVKGRLAAGPVGAAGDCFAIAPRIGSPPAKPASL